MPATSVVPLRSCTNSFTGPHNVSQVTQSFGKPICFKEKSVMKDLITNTEDPGYYFYKIVIKISYFDIGAMSKIL